MYSLTSVTSRRSLHFLSLATLCLLIFRYLRSQHPRALFEAYTHRTSTRASSRLAYTTWLSATVADPSTPWRDDHYFTATRMLVYQLLHQEETRTQRNIPIVVLCTPDVSVDRRERLKKDGAQVVDIDLVEEGSAWLSPGSDRWRDVTSKFRAWQLVQYDRVLFFDSDTVLQRCMDGVFDDANATAVATRLDPEYGIDVDESETTGLVIQDPTTGGTLPSTYLMASTGELPGPLGHRFPPDWGDFKNPGAFCAGFFLFAPSKEMFEYYLSFLRTSHSYDSTLPEQSLMVHAHRWDGPMPWRELSSTWNIRSVNENDFDQGVASMHEKWWVQPPISGSRKVGEWFLRVRWEMEGFYAGRDSR
jgi:alpha-N-acetylglucosamine transferase